MLVQLAVNRPSSVKDVADQIRYKSGCSSAGRARASKANAVGHGCHWAGIHPNVPSEKAPVVLCAEYRMVSEKAGAAALVANFAEKGLGVQQLVALSGAHTIGEHSQHLGLWLCNVVRANFMWCAPSGDRHDLSAVDRTYVADTGLQVISTSYLNAMLDHEQPAQALLVLRLLCCQQFARLQSGSWPLCMCGASVVASMSQLTAPAAAAAAAAAATVTYVRCHLRWQGLW
jgi:hypothetical protein